MDPDGFAQHMSFSLRRTREIFDQVQEDARHAARCANIEFTEDQLHLEQVRDASTLAAMYRVKAEAADDIRTADYAQSIVEIAAKYAREALYSIHEHKFHRYGLMEEGRIMSKEDSVEPKSGEDRTPLRNEERRPLDGSNAKPQLDRSLDGPLDGIRVLDLSALAPGPYCSMLLADMGAEVIMVEPVDRPRGRREIVGVDPNEERRRYSAYALGRGKRSIGLNLKSGEAREIFYRLCERADVVLEGFRPGVVARLGVDWERIRKINPRIVYCSLSGFGQTGPYARHVGHDINYIAAAGALGMIGDREAGGRPAIPANIIADFAGGGLMAAFAIVCALQAREQTHEGQYIDLGMSDGVLSLITSALAGYEGAGADMRPAAHVLNGGEPHYQVYETSDGRWFSVGSMEPYFYANLCRELDCEEFIEDQGTTDPSRRREIRERFAAVFKMRTAEEWHERLNAVDVCAKPVFTLEQALADEHNIARGMVVEVETPEGGRMRQAGVAPKLSATPGRVRGSAPRRGQDTEPLLALLGLEAAAVTGLRERGIVA